MKLHSVSLRVTSSDRWNCKVLVSNWQFRWMKLQSAGKRLTIQMDKIKCQCQTDKVSDWQFRWMKLHSAGKSPMIQWDETAHSVSKRLTIQIDEIAQCWSENDKFRQKKLHSVGKRLTIQTDNIAQRWQEGDKFRRHNRHSLCWWSGTPASAACWSDWVGIPAAAVESERSKTSVPRHCAAPALPWSVGRNWA